VVYFLVPGNRTWQKAGYFLVSQEQNLVKRCVFVFQERWMDKFHETCVFLFPFLFLKVAVELGDE